MSIQTELTRITNAKAAIKTAIEGKGVTVPDGTLLNGMASLIESIQAGGGGGACGSFTPESTINLYKGYSIDTGLTSASVFGCFIDTPIPGSYNIAVLYTVVNKSWIITTTDFNTLYSVKTSNDITIDNGIVNIPESKVSRNFVAGSTFYWVAG